MSTVSSSIAAVVFLGSLLAAVAAGMGLRRRIPEHHLNGDSRDAMKLSIGLIATMSALLLGLLVSSAKSSYDSVRGDVLRMAAKINMLDRVLEAYGPETGAVRAQLRGMVAEGAQRMWSEGEARARLAPDTRSGAALHAALQQLAPGDEAQRVLKAQAGALIVQLGEIQSLLVVQTTSAIATPLLVCIAAWFGVIFLGFSILAPANPTVFLSFAISAVSVSVAIFLILELDRPFDGTIQIPSALMRNALGALT